MRTRMLKSLSQLVVPVPSYPPFSASVDVLDGLDQPQTHSNPNPPHQEFETPAERTLDPSPPLGIPHSFSAPLSFRKERPTCEHVPTPTKKPNSFQDEMNANQGQSKKRADAEGEEDSIEEEMTEIIPNFLYLGSVADACNFEFLRQKQIECILCVAKECDAKYEAALATHSPSGPILSRLFIPMEDTAEENVLAYFSRCFEYIEAARQNQQRILVHCSKGISRSPTIVIGYLIQHWGYYFKNAYRLVREKRKIACPRLSFLLALEEFSGQGYDSEYINTIASQVMSPSSLTFIPFMAKASHRQKFEELVQGIQGERFQNYASAENPCPKAISYSISMEQISSVASQEYLVNGENTNPTTLEQESDTKDVLCTSPFAVASCIPPSASILNLQLLYQKAQEA